MTIHTQCAQLQYNKENQRFPNKDKPVKGELVCTLNGVLSLHRHGQAKMQFQQTGKQGHVFVHIEDLETNRKTGPRFCLH